MACVYIHDGFPNSIFLVCVDVWPPKVVAHVFAKRFKTTENVLPSVNLLKAAGVAGPATDHCTVGQGCPADCPFNRQQQA